MATLVASDSRPQIIIQKAIFGGSNNVLADTFFNNDLAYLDTLLKEIQDTHAQQMAALIKTQLDVLGDIRTPEEEKKTCLRKIGSLFGGAIKMGTFIYSNHKFFLAAYQLARPFAESYGISLPNIPFIDA